MARLRELPLVKAAILDTAPFSDAVAALFEAQVPCARRPRRPRVLVGVISELAVLRSQVPRNLAEVRHTAFLADDLAALDKRARDVRDRPACEFACTVEALDAEESETHAAERLLHSGEQALPVVEGECYLGMLSIAALCYARVDRVRPE